MKTQKLNLLCFLLLASSLFAAPGGWMVDYEAAKAKAIKENKDILLEFTGSDWCPPCKALAKNVFKTDAFINEATKSFVLVKLDFPRNKSKQSKEEIKQNKELQQNYNISGYPTIILTDTKGAPFFQTVGYRGETPKKYVEMIQSKISLRTERDKLFALAKKAEGTDRAIALDKALGETESNILHTYFAKEIQEIIKLDADNKAGFKEKYESKFNKFLIQRDLKKVRLEADKNPEMTIAGIDKIIQAYQPKGETLQGLLITKAQTYLKVKKKDEAKVLLTEALELAPKSKKAKRISKMLKKRFK